MATVTLSPTTGGYNTLITVTGLGFAVTTAITITLDGVAVVTNPSSITTDGSGDFTATFTNNKNSLGVYAVIVTDGTTPISTDWELLRKPEYVSVSEVADWIRITVNANTDPTRNMVENLIMDNEDRIDRMTQHTWLTEKNVTEEFSVNPLWDWGRGMPLFPRKRNLRTFDETKGDKFEVWDGSNWVDQTTASPQQLFFQEIKGIIYLRGYIFTILRTNRFRVTYRYGGYNDQIISKNTLIPRDIKKACKLMTCIDLLSTDFQMSQVAYGGEGNVDKQKVMNRWNDEADEIIWANSEITSVW